jgi:hypothetical protein
VHASVGLFPVALSMPLAAITSDLLLTSCSAQRPAAVLLLCTHSKRLAKMISTMRERMSAKLGNNNDNAFRMRKLFKMYDKTDSGMVRHYASSCSSWHQHRVLDGISAHLVQYSTDTVCWASCVTIRLHITSRRLSCSNSNLLHA